MALSQSTLKDLYLARFPTFGTDVVATAENFIADYKTYAADAVSCAGGSPLALEAAATVASGILAGVFATASDPVTAANGIASALTAFWLTPPMPFSATIPPALPGVVTVVGGTAALATALAAAVPTMSTDTAATFFSSLIHAFTLTVAVLHVIPPAASCALPIQ